MILHRAMPLLVLALLLGLPQVLPNRVVVSRAGEARCAAVAAAVAAAPYRIGMWVGRDEQFAPAAIKLLHPTAVLSRRFDRIGTGASANVLAVHCTDVRDMRGHWPPTCYPMTGWSEGTARQDVELTIAGRRVPAREYEFRRVESGGWETRIRVVDFFILPDGRITGDLQEISRRSERLALAALGVAQVQVVTPRSMPGDVAAAAATELLEGMPGLLEALGVVSEETDHDRG